MRECKVIFEWALRTRHQTSRWEWQQNQPEKEIAPSRSAQHRSTPGILNMCWLYLSSYETTSIPGAQHPVSARHGKRRRLGETCWIIEVSCLWLDRLQFKPAARLIWNYVEGSGFARPLVWKATSLIKNETLGFHLRIHGKYQIANPKIQVNHNDLNPKSQTTATGWCLRFVYLNLEFVCHLVLGIYDFSLPRDKRQFYAAPTC